MNKVLVFVLSIGLLFGTLIGCEKMEEMLAPVGEPSTIYISGDPKFTYNPPGGDMITEISFYDSNGIRTTCVFKPEINKLEIRKNGYIQGWLRSEDPKTYVDCKVGGDNIF